MTVSAGPIQHAEPKEVRTVCFEFLDNLAAPAKEAA